LKSRIAAEREGRMTKGGRGKEWGGLYPLAKNPAGAHGLHISLGDASDV